MKQLRSCGLLAGDSLRPRVDLTIYGEPKSSANVALSEINSTDLTPSYNFNLLLGDTKLSDIIIQCGSETFRAHKAILAGQSVVFQAMLTSEMSELKSGVINVTDMTPTAMGTIIRYMYTGMVGSELDPDLLLEIIYGSEKYGLTSLKNHCFRKLATCITEENAGTLAVAAHFFGAEDCIKMTLKKFIES